MLTILNELGKHRNDETGEFDLGEFKYIYIVPMKALIQEMVCNFNALIKVFISKLAS